MNIDVDQIKEYTEFNDALLKYIGGIYPAHKNIIIDNVYYYTKGSDGFIISVTHSHDVYDPTSLYLMTQYSRSDIRLSSKDSLYKYIKALVRDNKLNDILV